MPIDKSVQGIALNLIKFSVYARRLELRRSLERMSFEILEEVAKRDFASLKRTIASLEAIIRFGKTIYEIEPVNATILLDQLLGFNSAIRQIAELSEPDFENLSDSSPISKNYNLFEDLPVESKQPESASKEVSESGNLAVSDLEVKPKKIKARKLSDPGENPAIRQSAIVERIRQSGNKEIKFKDILAEFSNVSERTIRYDLERLCKQGVLERVGIGGPSTYYKLREI